jgi:flagellar basal-body rod protein FlgG
MQVQAKLNDVTANNLANVNTAGFKKDTGVVRSFPEMLLHWLGDASKMDNPSHLPPMVGYLSTGALLEEVIPSVHVPGILQETENPLDVAIIGNAYFVVGAGPGGEERFTRQGNFKLAGDGMLVTNDGHPVLGENGAIYITGTNIEINKTGQIFADGLPVDTLRAVRFVDENGNDSRAGLEKAGNTLFRHPNPQAVVPANGFQLVQGFLEGSNVSPVEEMVAMIQVMRAYEANQKAVQAHDQTLEKAVNEVGRS